MNHEVTTMVASCDGTNAVEGRVRWAPTKSLWLGSMTLGGLAAPVFFFSWEGALLFGVSTATTLCLGHSLGMHRRLIHRAYEAPRWLERLFVYLGTLVGMAGPLGMMRIHDLRDWAQRQEACHDYFGHRRGLIVDGWWQLHCEIALDRPPRFVPPADIACDRFYRLLEHTWMAQQLPWAMIFYAFGGIGLVAWGVCARVAVGVTGHWLIGHFAHRRGHRAFDVRAAAVQGFNVRIPGVGAPGSWLTGALTFGECWHNNHHAYPGSARIGLAVHEIDPGWWVLRGLRGAGLVRNLVLPDDLPHRPSLHRLSPTVTAAAPAYPLHLLYDRTCPVCRSEMFALKARDQDGRLALVDISAPGFDPAPWGATLAQMNARIYAVDAAGATLIGVPALRAAYAAVGLGAWVAPTGWPLIAPVADAAYAAFARHRYAISRVAGPLLEALGAWRARRAVARIDACGEQCGIGLHNVGPEAGHDFDHSKRRSS